MPSRHGAVSQAPSTRSSPTAAGTSRQLPWRRVTLPSGPDGSPTPNLERTPSSGPRREIRPPESLMPAPQQVPLVVAAVHHACHTLTRLAWAQEGVIRTAAQAGRILVPTRSLPDDLDIPHPYTQAPREHIDRLLSGIPDRWPRQQPGDHRGRSRQPKRSGAPSRVLAAAMATEPGHDRDDTDRFVPEQPDTSIPETEDARLGRAGRAHSSRPWCHTSRPAPARSRP